MLLNLYTSIIDLGHTIILCKFFKIYHGCFPLHRSIGTYNWYQSQVIDLINMFHENISFKMIYMSRHIYASDIYFLFYV